MVRDNIAGFIPEFIMDVEDGRRVIITPYEIDVFNIDKRIRGYIELLDAFYDNSISESEFWFNIGCYFKTKTKIHSIATDTHKTELKEHELGFVFRMQKRLKDLRKKDKK